VTISVGRGAQEYGMSTRSCTKRAQGA
jgi:hypothetical protein